MKIIFPILIISCYANMFNNICGEHQCKICVRVLQVDVTHTIEYLRAKNYCKKVLTLKNCCEKYERSENSLVPAMDDEKSEPVDEKDIFVPILSGLFVWIVVLAFGSKLTVWIYKFKHCRT
jgi:hypothetical protein